MTVPNIPNTGLANKETRKFLELIAKASDKGKFSIVTTTEASYDLTPLNYTVIADATSNAIVINLPLASRAKGRIFVIKKVDASANAVTLTPRTAETIDGSATKSTTTQYATYTIQSDGSNWHLIL